MSDKVLNHINLGLIMIIASFPILSFGLRSISSILLLVFSLFFYLKTRKRFDRPWKVMLVYSLPLLMLAFSLSYSEQIRNGVKDLIQLLSFIVFPLAIILNPIPKKQVDKIKVVFVVSVLVLVIYQIVMVGLNFETVFSEPSKYELKINGIFDGINAKASEIQEIKTRRFRSFSKSITNSDPTYQSIWLVFSIILTILNWKKNKSFFIRLLSVFGIILMLVWLLMLSSRMPIIGGILGALVIYLRASFKTNIILILILIIASLLAYKYISSINYRINEVFNTGMNLISPETKVRDFNSTNIRLGIYKCSLKLNLEKPFLGYGLGNVQNHLSNCLVSNVNSKIFSWRDYNTHNQYIYVLLVSGYLGIIVFFYWIYYLFQVAIKYRLYLFTCLFLFVLFCFMTENILARNDGVLFFGFFTGLVFFNPLSNEDT